MKIRFRKTTNIRKDNSSLSIDPVGEVYADTELEVDGTLHEGADVNGDNRWWRDNNGWFYWAGETEAILPLTPELNPVPEPPVIIVMPPVQPSEPPTPLPPVAAIELVALPASEDLKADFLLVPEGEWQSDHNKEVSVAPRPKKINPGNTKPVLGEGPLTPLQYIIKTGRTVSTDELNHPANRLAAIELQSRLCELGILDPEIGGDLSTPFGPLAKGDGIIGANSRAAITEFCRLTKIPYLDKQLTTKILQKLLAADADTFLPVEFANASDDTASIRLIKRILRYMDRKGYWIARSPRMRNIVYIEGMNVDGSLNSDAANHWNDRRIVFRIGANSRPEMLVNDQCTTEPGSHYIWNPLEPNGAARIAFGQYKAWAMGLHRGLQPALVQREKVRLHRDLNQDGFRSPHDPIDVGKTFGINQHSTQPGSAPEFVDSYSAGCLVGRRWAWHLAFLNIVKQDERYRQNQGYLFISTIIAGDDLAKFEPV